MGVTFHDPPVYRATTFRILKTSEAKPFSAVRGAKRISGVARHELAGRTKGIQFLHSLKDGLCPLQSLPGETSFTGKYSSHH